MNGFHPDAAWFRALRARLRAWFRAAARELPWRKTRDPYQVWLSEVMLQQTQVATVIDYFDRFVRELPTLHALAAAEEETVLRLWEGLGYYRRARQLHAAARRIVAEHGGEFPREYEEVLSLPGIGRYTAGAILSIAFDQPRAIVEANTQRLYARLLGYEGDPRTAEGQRRLWGFAEQVVPRRGAGEANQALMELGALLCTPRDPKCLLCPLAQLCAARREGIVDRIPPAAPRPEFEEVTEAALLVRHRNRVLLRRCAAGERWGGLWDFPRYGITGGGWEGAAEDHRQEWLAGRLREQFGIEAAIGPRLGSFKHGVTRFRITLHYHTAELLGPRPRSGAAFKWVAPRSLEEVPLSSTGRKLARLLNSIRW